MSTSDGISEAFEEHLRAAVMMGTQLAQRHIQNRADRERERAGADRATAQQSSDAQRDALSAQRAQREATIADLRKVSSETWWEHADVDEIRRTWTSAYEHHSEDPRAADAAWRMADRFSELGIADPDRLGEQPELTLRTPLSDDELRAYQQHLDAQEDRYEQRADAGEDVTTQRGELQELRGAVDEQLASEPRRRGGPPLSDQAETIAIASQYDSHERREHLSERLRTLGLDEETTRAVDVAEHAPARPIADAVTAGQTSTAAPQARRAPPRKNTLRRSQR